MRKKGRVRKTNSQNINIKEAPRKSSVVMYEHKLIQTPLPSQRSSLRLPEIRFFADLRKTGSVKYIVGEALCKRMETELGKNLSVRVVLSLIILRSPIIAYSSIVCLGYDSVHSYRVPYFF